MLLIMLSPCSFLLAHGVPVRGEKSKMCCTKNKESHFPEIEISDDAVRVTLSQIYARRSVSFLKKVRRTLAAPHLHIVRRSSSTPFVVDSFPSPSQHH
jgi:hypothetical protein